METTPHSGFDDMWKTYDQAQSALKAAEAASGMGGGVQSIFYYDWMVAGKVFIETIFENMAVALATAVIVILAMTRNYKVTHLHGHAPLHRVTRVYGHVRVTYIIVSFL